jgi:hypothetical protein
MDIWSDYGGRERHVRIVHPRGVWGRDPRRTAVASAVMAAPLLLFVTAAPRRVLVEVPAMFANWNKAVEDAGAGAAVLLILILSWTIVGIYGAVRFVRIAPDIVNRVVVKGPVIYHEFVEGYSGGEGPSEPDERWIAIDDGLSDSVPAYKLDARAFASVSRGDYVRLTIAPRSGYVFDVERLDWQRPSVPNGG